MWNAAKKKESSEFPWINQQQATEVLGDPKEDDAKTSNQLSKQATGL